MAKEKITPETAVEGILALLDESGLKVSNRQGHPEEVRKTLRLHASQGMSGHFTFEQPAWGLEAAIHFSLSGETSEVTVGWSATRRSPHSARAAVVLYERVTDLACLLQAYLDGKDIRPTKSK